MMNRGLVALKIANVAHRGFNRFPAARYTSREFAPLTSTEPSIELVKESVPFDLPLQSDRQLSDPVFCSTGQSPRQVWLESLKPLALNGWTSAHSPVGLIDLHPDVFAVFPRLDIVHKNLYWQAHYRMVDWRCITTRAELPYRSRRKPWPQKGTGRARHGNRRTHIWVGGGQCHGPRGPESFFYILPRSQRLIGLLSMLSVKLAQDDLHVVNDLRLTDELEQQTREILEEQVRSINDSNSVILQDDDPWSVSNRARIQRTTKLMNRSAQYLRQLIDERRWGPSVLFVTDVPLYDELMTGLCIPPNQPQQTLSDSNDISIDDYPYWALNFACSSYAHHIELELSPEASMFRFESVAPRAAHPGRGLTLMPVNSLSVWSLVHHDTVVFSLSALNLLETRLLAAQRLVLTEEKLESTMLKRMSPSDWSRGRFGTNGEFGDNSDMVIPVDHRRVFSDKLESEYWQRVNLTNS